MSTSDSTWYSGEVALVTGAPGRIGRAIALRLAAMGMNIAVHYHSSQEGAEETAAMAREFDVTADAFQADLGQGAEACHALAAAVERRLGAPSVLVNNASVFDAVDLAGLTESDWERTLRVNLQAPVFLAQAAMQRLGERRGHLIQLVDWRADNPIPGHLAYTIAKAGLAAMTRLLAQELAPRVQVNAVAPGAILPPPGHGREHLQSIAERIPLRRPGSPEEIVKAIDYLLQSDFVTGEILHVTGGQQLGAHG